MADIKPEQVPEAAWQAASGLWFNGAKWPQIVAAALNAWPGMYIGTDYLTADTQIKLPFPQQENSDD